MKKKSMVLFLLLLFCFKTINADPMMTSTEFDMTGFPQWARDLRRAEIVAFGAFPFMYMFTNFGFNTYHRLVSPPQDPQRATFRTIGIAAGAAVLISIVDHGIERHRRGRAALEAARIPDAEPIIIRTPLFGEEGDQLPETE